MSYFDCRHGCENCNGYPGVHDTYVCPCSCHDEFRAEELCRCGHEHLRHDMGNGCIECRCRRFAEAAR